LPGKTQVDHARGVVTRMQAIDPTVSDNEVPNVKRWIRADIGEIGAVGHRMPGAARDWHRFSVFVGAVGMPDVPAKAYWDHAVVPTRAYRAQERSIQGCPTSICGR
jgi:hypothetical protein